MAIEDADDTVAGTEGQDTLEGGTDTVSGAAADDTVQGDDTSGGTSSQKDGEDTSEGGDDSVAGAPEEYKDFTVPEGVQLDETALGAFKPVAKELGLTQEGAQKLVDLFVDTQKQQAEAFDTMKADWVKEAKADKEIGGAAYDQSVGYAKKAIAHFGNPKLQAALDWSGLGDHPEVIRAFSKIGKEISEDQGENGDTVSGGGAKTAEQVGNKLFAKSLKALDKKGN